MNTAIPHYLLFASAGKDRDGTWSFVLQAADGSEKIKVADCEPEAKGERLELLAVVRGLEALDQPSHVTLVTLSRYVPAGIDYGLDEWRRNDWNWEHYGQMAPVKNQDLWQRLDRALRFHRVEVRRRRFDLPHFETNRALPAGESPTDGQSAPELLHNSSGAIESGLSQRLSSACRRIRSRIKPRQTSWPARLA